MPVSYDKLWKMLIDKKMNRTDLKEHAGISFNILAKMGRNEFVSMESLYKVCTALNCDVGDIMEFTNNEHDYILPRKAQSVTESNHRRICTAFCAQFRVPLCRRYDREGSGKGRGQTP